MDLLGIQKLNTQQIHWLNISLINLKMILIV